MITGTNKSKIAELRSESNKRFGEGQWTENVDSYLGIRCKHDFITGIFSMDIEVKIETLIEGLGLTGRLRTTNRIVYPYA